MRAGSSNSSETFRRNIPVSRTRTLLISTAILAFALYELALGSKVHLFFGDFRAFYCAGSALVHGQNAYAASALYACERSPMPFGLYRALPGISVPAPLPGYALLFFAPLGALPYLAACAVWMVLLFASSIAAVVLLAKLVERPIPVAASVLAVGFAALVIPYGELATMVIAALLWMALALRREQWTAAACAGAVAMILPHLAAPALLAVFVLREQMRVRLIVLALILGALDILAGGGHSAIAYFTAVLPAHTISEVGSTSQYGLTWALHALGASDHVAIVLGEGSYIVMVIVGVAVAGAFVRRSDDAAFAVLIPPAFAVFGGAFMHYTEIMAAIPAALLVYTRASGLLRSVILAAIVLLAFPWAWALSQPQLIVAFAITGAAIAQLTGGADLRVGLRVALGCALVAAIIVEAGFHFGTGLTGAHITTHLDSSLAQASWAQYVRSQRASTGMVWWFAKAPTWIGLALFSLSCLSMIAVKRSAQIVQPTTS